MRKKRDFERGAVLSCGGDSRKSPGTVALNSRQDLQPAICHASVPDIINDNLATSMQYLVDHAIITDTDPVQVFCTGKFVSIVRHWFCSQVLDVLKNVGNYFFGNFTKDPFQRSS